MGFRIATVQYKAIDFILGRKLHSMVAHAGKAYAFGGYIITDSLIGKDIIL